MKIFIVGAGAHGRIALDILRAQGQASSIAFVDEDPTRWGGEMNGAPIVGGLNEIVAAKADLHGAVIAIGKPPARLAMAERLNALGVSFTNAIHPGAVVMPTARLGVGNIISPGVVIDTDAEIGNHCLVNAGCVIEHDCVLGDAVTLSPAVHMAGRVTIGDRVFVGIGANIVPRRVLGAGSVVGAAATIVADVPPDVMVVGSPAKLVWPVDESFDWSKLL